MFEMFATIVAACAAAIYGLSRSVFMSGVHRNLYRAAFIGIIILVYVTYRIYHYIKFKNIKKLNVDFDDYLYYDKYTSPLYRAGYFISYLVQNILFDYTYMKRNYNFCKGLDVYDGGVSEYYIKFRNTWYRYLKLTMIRHRISLKKLQAFSCDMKNYSNQATASSAVQYSTVKPRSRKVRASLLWRIYTVSREGFSMLPSKKKRPKLPICSQGEGALV